MKPDAAKDVFPWRRNLLAVWIGQLFSLIGFSAVFPFLPLYVQELGVTEPHEVELWSGLLGFAAGAAMSLTSPIWGGLADRHGRKPMLLRAAFGGALFLGMMGLVTSVEQLFILRFLQGAVTGVVAAANALAASFVPRARLGMALGMLQMAIFVGSSVGPFVGGFVADRLGYRASFFVTAAMLFLGGLVILLFVEERFERPAVSREVRFFSGLGGVMRVPALLAFAAVALTIHGSAMMVSPIFALFVQEVSPSEQNLASTVGLILAVAGVVSAISAIAIGRVSDRLGHRGVLGVCAAGAGLAYLPQAFSTDPNQILLWRAVLGLFAGGMMPSLSALIALRAPAGMQGAAFGLNATATSLGGAFGPLLGAWLATATSLRVVFVVAGLALLVVGVGAAFVGARPREASVRRAEEAATGTGDRRL